MALAPLVLTFDLLERAEAARAALLAAGFAGEAVRVVAREDEAGATQGDFTVGSGRPASASKSRYEANFGNEAKRGQVLMTVAVADSAARDRAREVTRPYGAIDVEGRATGGN